MKFEIRVEDKQEEKGSENGESTDLQPYTGEVSIDVGQVLAANQALLKNISRRMEEMENHVKSLGSIIERQTLALQVTIPQQALLMAPPKPVLPWRPEIPELNDEYFSGFSVFERLFRPDKMRRKNT